MYSNKDENCVEGLTEKGRKKELNRCERRLHGFGLVAFFLFKRGPSAKPKKAGQKKEVRIRLVTP